MTQSAGVLVYRRSGSLLEVLLVHPGGPYFRKKDDGAWTIPKGEPEAGEEMEATAFRELAEETGLRPAGERIPLGEVRQAGGKRVVAWAVEGDADTSAPPPSDTFEIEWPPRSGQTRSFPEVDAWSFYDLEMARQKINSAQAVFLDRLTEALAR
ncbi:MAG: NUDIX domain-containing protein [Planctomycetota bacterium]